MSAKSELQDSSSDRPHLLHVREILNSCSRAIVCGNIRESEKLVSELVNFLDSVSDASLSDPNNEDVKNNASEILSDICNFLCCPSLDQEVIDALSFELPKAVTKYASVSTCCLGIAGSIIDQFVSNCSPRDMLSILCEALDSLMKTVNDSDCFLPLLTGLSKVLLSTQRRQFQQAKVAVPVIIRVLQTVSSWSEDENTELQNLFDRALGIADSMHAVCIKLEGRANEKLRALLGLYILQIVVCVSTSLGCEIERCLPLVSRLSHFCPYCRLSYLGLINGADVDTMTSLVVGEDEDADLSCLSGVEQGASLLVIWGYISDQVAQAAEEDLSAIKNELRCNQTMRWQAVGMLKHVLSSVSLPWEFKKHAIDFLLQVTDGKISQKYDVKHNEDDSSYMPSLFAALQAVIMVIIYAPNSALRKNAFEAFKRVLAEIPRSEKHDILKALVTKTDSSSMVALLLDLVRQEVLSEHHQRISVEIKDVLPAENRACSDTHLWPAVALELVDLVLRPPKGGPPLLPENSDAVLSALNLYRFLLLTGSEVEIKTEALSKNSLQKAYHEWLLPLRTLVTGIMTENKNDNDQLAIDSVCALNPVELVLYRCIELVEEKLKHAT